MPSTFTPRLRLEMQAAGENLNTWGAPKLNNVIARLDAAIAGWTVLALTGDYALATSNGDDEARSAMLKFTGAGPFTVTIPSVSKRYDVWNACAAAVTLTSGAGAVAIIQPGEKVSVACDGVGVHRLQPTDFGGQRVTNLAAPTANQDAATKKYVDDTAFAASAGNLPGQAGNAGKVLTTDGTVASWAPPLPSQSGHGGAFLVTDGTNPGWAVPGTGSLSDYAADQLSRSIDTLYLARTRR